MRARAASLPLLLLLLLLLLAAGSGAAPALNASAEEASAGGGDGGCPAACDCERDARLWAWLPREESLSALCARRRLRALPRGDPELRHLDFSGNQLDALGVGQLASLGWAGLRTLDASGNALVRVEGGALRGLARLERLLLARNHLTELPRDLLADAPRLWFLSLAGNPLALPPDGRAFLAAPALQVLDLSACKLSAFPDDVLGEDNSLQELLVANNSIAQVRVHHLARLRRLDASDNRLRQLSADDLAGAPALRSLSLDGNPLGAQEELALPGGASLRALSVCRCGLRALPASAVGALPGLEELSLDDNALEEVPAAALSALPRLRRLSVRRNRLRAPPRLHHAALRALDLSGNAPMHLPADGGAWLSAPALRALHLARCGLRELRVEASLGGGAPQLRDLHLAHNALRGLGARAVTALPRLRALDLRGNPLRCDAALRPLWLAADARHVRVDATCLEPPGDWDMLRYVGDAASTTPAAPPADRNEHLQETTWPGSAETAPAEDDDDDDLTDELVRYGVRWGPVLGGFLLVVASVLLLRKWLDHMSTKRFQYSTKSKEYVYESEEDEDTTTTMITDAGSHSVSPLATPSSPLPVAPAPGSAPGPAPGPGPVPPPGRTRFAVVPTVVAPAS